MIYLIQEDYRLALSLLAKNIMPLIMDIDKLQSTTTSPDTPTIIPFSPWHKDSPYDGHQPQYPILHIPSSGQRYYLLTGNSGEETR